MTHIPTKHYPGGLPAHTVCTCHRCGRVFYGMTGDHICPKCAETPLPAPNPDNYTQKPPLGVMPHSVWVLFRQQDLARAIQDYRDAGLEPKPAWLHELEDLLERYPPKS